MKRTLALLILLTALGVDVMNEKKIVRVRDNLLWQKLMEVNTKAAEAIATDRESR